MEFAELDRARRLVGALLGGRYRPLREIGRGGMGVVFEAVDESGGGARVALKVLAEADEKAALRFFREAAATATIAHPAIVRATDWRPAGGSEPAFYMMELLEGESLAQRLRRGPLTVPEAARVAGEVLDALDAAHRASIVHRDIKPANVFLAKDGRVRVLDFGIAKLIADDRPPLTTVGTVLGSLAYMAPEQVLGEPVDARTDVHAVGTCLFEMLSGARPDGRLPAPELAVARARGSSRDVRELAPHVPDALAAIVARATARERDDRFPSARAMADALAPFASPAHDTIVEQRAPERRPRSRALFAGSFAATVIVGALAAVGAAVSLSEGPSDAPTSAPPPSSTAPPEAEPAIDAARASELEAPDAAGERPPPTPSAAPPPRPPARRTVTVELKDRDGVSIAPDARARYLAWARPRVEPCFAAPKPRRPALGGASLLLDASGGATDVLPIFIASNTADSISDDETKCVVRALRGSTITPPPRASFRAAVQLDVEVRVQ